MQEKNKRKPLLLLMIDDISLIPKEDFETL